MAQLPSLVVAKRMSHEILHHVGDNGAKQHDDCGREDEEQERKKHLGGGFVGELFGAFETLLPELFSLNAQDGPNAHTQFVGLDKCGAKRSNLWHADAFVKIAQSDFARGANLDFTLHSKQFFVEGIHGAAVAIPLYGPHEVHARLHGERQQIEHERERAHDAFGPARTGRSEPMQGPHPSKQCAHEPYWEGIAAQGDEE